MATGTAAMATSLDGFHATASAQRSDELVRAFVAAVTDDDDERIDAAAARSFLSYDVHGTRSRTGFKRYVSELHRSFSGLRLEVHENIGVLVEGDLVALRTIITASANRDPLAVLFYATDDDTAAITIERLIRAAGFEPWKAGGVAAAGRIEAPGGDLHQYGFNGEVVDINRARAATAGSAA
jgi:hypothetical protein